MVLCIASSLSVIGAAAASLQLSDPVKSSRLKSCALLLLAPLHLPISPARRPRPVSCSYPLSVQGAEDLHHAADLNVRSCTHTYPCSLQSPAASRLYTLPDTDVAGLQDWALQLSERNWRSAVLVHNTNLFLHDWLKRAALKEGFCAFCCRSAPPGIAPLHAHTLAMLPCIVWTTCYHGLTAS